VDLFHRQNDADQWKAIRDLQEFDRNTERRLDALEGRIASTRARRDWLLTKLLPLVAALSMAFAALDTIFKWVG
jgi:hypothetical protein